MMPIKTIANMVVFMFAFTLYGCAVKLVSPKQDAAPVAAPIALKADAEIITYSFRAWSWQASSKNLIATKALCDSLAVYGRGCNRTDGQTDRSKAHIAIYQLDDQRGPIINSIGAPWVFATIGTAFIVPFYAKTHYPVEIHVIPQSNDVTQKFQTVRTEYAFSEFYWLPLLLMPKSLASTDTRYNKHLSPQRQEELTYIAYRRIFDSVVEEIVR